MKGARKRRGFLHRWADLLRQLRVAYAEGDVGSIRDLWYRAMAEPGVGIWLRLSNRLYPLQRLLDVSHELQQRMAEHGLARASRWLLDVGVRHWVSEVPPATQGALSSEPVIIYGNHPTLLTPFLVSAHVPRPDHRIVAASFLGQFLPAFGQYAIPVEVPVNQWWKQLWQGGLGRLAVAYWATRLRPVLPRPTARQRNQAALERACAHVRQGGSLLIAPTGWSRSGKRWYPGIGRIVRDLATEPGERPVWLVAYHEEGTSDRLVRRLLEGGEPCPGRRGAGRDRPPRIRFSEPVPLSALDPQGGTVNDLVERLRRRYDETFLRPRNRADHCAPRRRRGIP